MKIEIIVKCQFKQQEETINAGTITNAKIITNHLIDDNYTIKITTTKGVHFFKGMNAWYFYSLAFENYNKKNQALIPAI